MGASLQGLSVLAGSSRPWGAPTGKRGVFFNFFVQGGNRLPAPGRRSPDLIADGFMAAIASNAGLGVGHPGRGSRIPAQILASLRTGITVFAGMLGVTLFGLFLIPVFYVALRKLATRRQYPVSLPQHAIPAHS